ncbi:MAG: adenine deaminase [Bacteroidales bacterium]|jgi:adenine deaminase
MTQNTKALIGAAMGKIKCDLLLENANLVNVLSGRIEENVSIAIKAGTILGVGTVYEADKRLDLGGKYVYPGLIDSHIHLESTKLSVFEAAKLMLRFGTTTVISDPHEITNVAGVEGLRFQMRAAAANPYVNVFFTIPSCVPALADPNIESFASHLDAAALEDFLGREDVVGLGEMMNLPGVLMGDSDVLQKIMSYRAAGLAIDGHAPLLSGRALNAYICAGVASDHESSQRAEAQEKLDRGMHIMIREGSSERNLDELLPVVNEFNAMRMSFASDDLDPADMAARGHINHMLKRAVAAGVSPIRALQMATISPALYYKISHKVGAIFPGAQADLVVANDLIDFEPLVVLHKGEVLYRNDEYASVAAPKYESLRSCMNVVFPSAQSLAVPRVEGAEYRAISMIEGQILTQEYRFVPDSRTQFVQPKDEDDVAKIVVFERHKGSGSYGIGFVHGFGIKSGAIASSVAHDSHNLIVVGTNDEDILAAAKRLTALGGGQLALCKDEFCEMPLPIAGLMSNVSAEELIAQEHKIHEFCKNKLKISLERPFAAISFLSLPVIPQLRVTDKGLFGIAPGGYPQKLALYVEESC